MSCDTTMRPLSTPPDTGRKVVLWFKQKTLKSCRKVVVDEKICQTYARYYAAFIYECDHEDECDCDYDEDRDNYFMQKGWYESSSFNDEYCCWPVVENEFRELIGWTEKQPEPRMI